MDNGSFSGNHPVTSDQSQNRLLEGRTPSLLAALLFVLALAPIAGNFIFFHPDETFYTNAPISMMQTGDVLTPRNGQGELRFNKPILTYWAVLGSYEIFGVSGFTTRLPFLLAGALTIWLTYQLVMLLFAQSTTALIASLIVASHPLTITAAMRANPDMLMSLFLLVSVHGLFSLLQSQQIRSFHYYLTYLGFGLAFAVKGPFPVVVFAGISLLFVLFNPWRRLQLTDLIHISSLTLSLMIALSWFIAMFAIHGAEGMGMFVDDHVSGRVGFQWAKIVGNIAIAAAVLLLLFLPWNLILLHLGIKRSIRQSLSDSETLKLFAAFAAVWSIAIVVMSGPVAVFYPRYLLPVIPLLAIAMAYVINHAESPVVRRWAGILAIFAVLLSLPFLGGGMMMALAQSEMVIFAVTAILSAIGIAAIVTAFRSHSAIAMISLFATILLLLPSLFLFARPFALPDQGTQVAAKLEKMSLLKGKRIAYLGEINPAAKIRIAAGPELELHEVSNLSEEQLNKFDAVVFLHKKKPENLLSGYEIQLAAKSWSTPPLEQLLAAGSLQQAAQILREPDQIHYVAFPKTTNR